MRQCSSCVTNRLDYHYGNARNNGYSHALAEQIARFMVDAERKPRLLPVVLRTVEYDPDGIYMIVSTGQPDEWGIYWEYEMIWWRV